ncbi:2-methylisocitrate lyase [Candidatus Lokiarchaeum ossiferum]|uniref:phosphoenolpyruvate mutase n=1 Tax=Candidatus Lokiarchaeum ossiferum TaxID=2951803 RepID=A0ABY6HWM8_9ARCH|nr:2-methylisocitrate lyase [Candidatus Lokiarchaeum sp. B-35]
MTKVYVAMSADFIHPGHIKIIKEARKLGTIIIGMLTDEAIATYRRIPVLNYEQRKEIISIIEGISEIIPQKTLDYSENLYKIKPDYVVHGTNWKEGPQRHIREKVINILNEWGGKLIEPEYSQEYNSDELFRDKFGIGTTPELRLRKLRQLIELKPIVRILEVHNGLTGRIVEETRIVKGEMVKEFDGMWESSLTDSTSKGKPDTGAVDITSRLKNIDEILEVTTKPMIVDADSGGLTEHFIFTVKKLERLGVSAVIIEDKVGPKRNSLFGTDVKQTQDSIENFAAKINAGKKAQITPHFMIIARIESLILKQGQADALARAKAYIKAGADAIMIHSKEKEPTEILDFCKEFAKLEERVPIVVVPSTYCQITEDELIKAGIKIVIYANHLLRSAYPNMVATAKSILQNERAKEASEKFCMPIKEILELIPGGK